MECDRTHTHTRTLVLVIQRVVAGDEPFAKRVADALEEYLRDLRLGHAGNGVFERHVNAGCRIEAIASIPPVLGSEAREDVVAANGIGALAHRLRDMHELATYLPGGENAHEIAAALGYTPEQASEAIRVKVAEALAALPEDA